MPKQVVDGAMLACSFGATPSMLSVLPINLTNCSNKPAATIQDHAPNVNIKPFGMCLSPTNPQVIAATSAALGVFTPQPCIPVTPAPWVPGAPTVQIANQFALDDTSKCNCMWAGVISITVPGQIQTDIP
jgi:hypothetical protein